MRYGKTALSLALAAALCVSLCGCFGFTSGGVAGEQTAKEVLTAHREAFQAAGEALLQNGTVEYVYSSGSVFPLFFGKLDGLQSEQHGPLTWYGGEKKEEKPFSVSDEDVRCVSALFKNDTVSYIRVDNEARVVMFMLAAIDIDTDELLYAPDGLGEDGEAEKIADGWYTGWYGESWAASYGDYRLDNDGDYCAAVTPQDGVMVITVYDWDMDEELCSFETVSEEAFADFFWELTGSDLLVRTRDDRLIRYGQTESNVWTVIPAPTLALAAPTTATATEDTTATTTATTAR